MKDVSKGRFERYECTACGAHLRTRSAEIVSARCEVCGNTELTRIAEKPSGPLHGVVGHQPDRAQRR